LNISSVHSGLSLSISLGFGFLFIPFHFTFIGLTKADNLNSLFGIGKHQRVNPPIQQAKVGKANLGVSFSSILLNDGRFEIEAFD
jgi:hypothetical protein